jgi:hypothetical protein
MEKAQTVAQIIRTYGADLAAIEGALMSGGQMPQQQQQFQDPRLDGLLSKMEQFQQAQTQRIEAKAGTEVDQFGSGKEFFDDVREDMADLLEIAARRGVDLTLEQAYDRAVVMNPEVSRIVAARAAAANAGTANTAIQQAQRAASNVRGTPSGVPSAGPSTLRGAIEAAIESSSGR